MTQKRGIKVYLSGPMSGRDDNNVREFAVYARRLRLLGFEVWNPAETEVNVGQPWGHCLKNDLAHMLQCDGIALLPDWKDSRGARLELYVAIAIGMEVYDAATGNPMPMVAAEPYLDTAVGPRLQEMSTHEDDFRKLNEILDDTNQPLSEYAAIQEVDTKYHQEFTPAFEEPEEESCIDEAKRIVGGPRRRDYDHPLDNHQRIANQWNDYLELPEDRQITPENVAWMMILLKIAREMHTHKRDNVVDVIGYAHCIDEMQRERKRRASA